MNKHLKSFIFIISTHIITTICILINAIINPSPLNIGGLIIMVLALVIELFVLFLNLKSTKQVDSKANEETTILDEQVTNEFLIIDDSLCEISNSMYMNDLNIKEVTMHDNITKIGNSAFKWCSYLTKVTLSDNLEHIGLNAFSNCHNLEKIFIPKSVKYIGGWAFDKCNKLTIYCEAESIPEGWEKNWNPTNCEVIFGAKQN